MDGLSNYLQVGCAISARMSQAEEIKFRLQKFAEFNKEIEKAVTKAPIPKPEKLKANPLVLDVTRISKYRIFNDNSLTNEELHRYFSSFGQVLDFYIPKIYGTEVDKPFAYFTILRPDQSKIRDGWHTVNENGQQIKVTLEVSNNYANISTKCIVVSASPKLMAKLTESVLRDNFKKFGKIKEIRIPLDTRKKTLLHCAFVEFKSSESVEKAIQHPVCLINNLPFSVSKSKCEQTKRS